MLAGRPSTPTWPDLGAGKVEAFPSPPALPTDTIPPTMHAPVLPMIALVSGVASMAALVALALIGSLVDDQGWQAHPIGVGLSALACLVIGGVGTLGGLFIGPLALVREPRWKPASISGTVLAACAAALVVIALLAPE